MINDYTIIAGTFLTNAVIGGYSPTSQYSLKSLGLADYVDEVLVAEGNSIDDTINAHANIPKVTWVNSGTWDINSFHYRDANQQYATLLDYCNKQHKPVILTINWGDTIYTPEYRNELQFAIEKFINSPANFMNLPGGMKVLNKNYRTREYGTEQQFYTLSAYKFNDKTNWYAIDDDKKTLTGNVKPIRHDYDWKSSYMTYEMFTFNRKQFEAKIKKHCEWNNSASVDDTIEKKLLAKSHKIGIVKMKKDDHPREAHDLIDLVTNEQYGYDCFGHLK